MRERLLIALGGLGTIIFILVIVSNYYGNNLRNFSQLGTVLVSAPISAPTGHISINQIKEIHPTALNGRVWYSDWDNGIGRKIKSGKRDISNDELIARGSGSISINGKGVAQLSGGSPRMYVYDRAENKKWNNVEVTIYGKRVSESDILSSQGFVIGARSEHQDATLDNSCSGRTYYGRLLYDGRAVFQKEVIHEGAYSINKPEKNYRVFWNTPDETLPKNKWIGVKFIVRTNPDQRSVKLELYRDLTDGYKGGAWEKVAEYTDAGDWSKTDTGADTLAKCGYSASEVLLRPGTSVFIRNDEVTSAEYKLFSIREIQ